MAKKQNQDLVGIGGVKAKPATSSIDKGADDKPGDLYKAALYIPRNLYDEATAKIAADRAEASKWGHEYTGPKSFSELGRDLVAEWVGR